MRGGSAASVGRRLAASQSIDGRRFTQGARVLLVDTIGELGAWWGTAEIAFVGGSFGRRGGQNMLEPAAYGAAVCFGPNTWNFRDVVQRLLEADAARVVADGEALTAFVRQCLESPSDRQRLGRNARRLVRANQGAARSSTRQILQLLPPPLGSRWCPAAARPATLSRTRQSA